MFENKNKIEITIFILAATGIINSIFLVIFEMFKPGTCPMFFIVSGCSVSLIAFVFVLLTHFIKNEMFAYFIFYTGAFSGFIIDSIFSYRAMFNTVNYPEIGSIPICLFSCLLFFFAIILNISNYKKQAVVQV